MTKKNTAPSSFTKVDYEFNECYKCGVFHRKVDKCFKRQQTPFELNKPSTVPAGQTFFVETSLTNNGPTIIGPLSVSKGQTIRINSNHISVK